MRKGLSKKLIHSFKKLVSVFIINAKLLLQIARNNGKTQSHDSDDEYSEAPLTSDHLGRINSMSAHQQLLISIEKPIGNQ